MATSIIFYVYILMNEAGKYYKGFTTHPMRRLEEHNSGLSRFTSDKGPWEMVYLEVVPTKRIALNREKNLKKATKERIQWLISSEKNLLQSADADLSKF